MAEEYQRVVDLPVKTASGISLLSDYLMGIDSNDGYQMLINDLAKRIVEDYVGSSLGGSSRTLKDALDAISNKIGSTTMGTTATTVTGAIKEHNDKIGSVAMGTTATTLTGAIKEHNDKIGNSTMGTTATTLTGAIAEHEDDIENINDLVGDTSMGTTATTITGAIAEHESDISTLNSNFTWKYVGQATGANNVSLSGINYNELFVEISIDGGINKAHFFVPKIVLPTGSSVIYLRQGGSDNTSSTREYVVVAMTASRIAINQVCLFGNNSTSTSVCKVWYR